MQKQQQRRQQVQWALRIVAGTPLNPGFHERQLLARYVDGTLSLDQIIALLEEQPADGAAPTPNPTGSLPAATSGDVL